MNTMRNATEDEDEGAYAEDGLEEGPYWRIARG
jgi:hypothetical protein